MRAIQYNWLLPVSIASKLASYMAQQRIAMVVCMKKTQNRNAVDYQASS